MAALTSDVILSINAALDMFLTILSSIRWDFNGPSLNGLWTNALNVESKLTSGSSNSKLLAVP